MGRLDEANVALKLGGKALDETRLTRPGHSVEEVTSAERNAVRLVEFLYIIAEEFSYIVKHLFLGSSRKYDGLQWPSRNRASTPPVLMANVPAVKFDLVGIDLLRLFEKIVCELRNGVQPGVTLSDENELLEERRTRTVSGYNVSDSFMVKDAGFSGDVEQETSEVNLEFRLVGVVLLGFGRSWLAFARSERGAGVFFADVINDKFL
jgi:hypothetical protein